MHHLQATSGSAAACFGRAASRSLWTSSPALSAELAQVLKEEVIYENENYQKPDIVKSGPPKGWTLVDEPGDTLITLKKTAGGEEIEVNLQVNSQPEGGFANDDGDVSADDDDENQGETTTVAFNVHVIKGDYALVIECESDGTSLQLLHASYEPKSGYESESSYTGPVFEELDDNLQERFREYVEARGVNEELGEYLRHLIYDKEQREYVRWLGSVAKFVSK